jgi:zinc protease
MIESASGIRGTVQRTSWGDVPVYWLEAADPFVGALLFRVGRADETLRIGGLTHLVEHLALSTIDRTPYQHNGQVEAAITAFYARGSAEEVLRHMTDLAGAIADLPLDRLESERRILGAEASTVPLGLDARLMSLRFGPVGYGLVNHPELALDWVTPEEVAAWAGEHFTRGNAAVWLTGEPPDEVSELALTPGQPSKPHTPEPIPSLELPGHLAEGTGGLAVSFVAKRSAPIHAGFLVAVERAHKRLRRSSAMSYAPSGSYLSLDGNQVHVVVNADCKDQDALHVQDELLGILDELAEDGPTDEELEWDRTMLERMLNDPNSEPSELDAFTRDALMGIELPTREELLRERDELTASAVSDALAEAMNTLLVLAPTGVAPSGRRKLSKYAPENTELVEGKTYKVTLEWKEWGELSELTVGNDGFSYVSTSTGDVMSLSFADCPVGIQLLSGAMTVVGRDGSWVTVYPHRYERGDEALRQIEDGLGRDRLVPVGNRARELDPTLRHQLSEREVGRVAAEIDLLSDLLGGSEEIRGLAEARREHQIGLLAVTDRRLLFVFWGTNEKEVFEQPLNAISGVKVKGLRTKWLEVTHEGGTTQLRDIEPKARAQEIADLLSSG